MKRETTTFSAWISSAISCSFPRTTISIYLAGRYHTAIGYYNTAYHHSTWLQTATGRPFLFKFEDDSGILPIHNVGVSVTGIIPSGRLGLHYIAEVGNGRASSSPNAEPVQNTVDENNGKSFNLRILFRPTGVRGLQAGFPFTTTG